MRSSLKVPQLAEFIRESRVDADNDRALAQRARALDDADRARLLLPHERGGGRAQARRGGHRAAARGHRGLQVPAGRLHRSSSAAEVPFLKAYAPQGNLDMFTAVAPSSGYFSVASDPDGVVRWMPLVIQARRRPVSAAVDPRRTGITSASRELAVRVRARAASKASKIGDRFVPTDEAGQMLINYRGPPKTFPHYSISDILGGKLPQRHVQGQDRAWSGRRRSAIGDIRSTPFAPVYPGPEIHATVIDNILTGDFIARPRWSRIFDLLAIVVLPLLVAGRPAAAVRLRRAAVRRDALRALRRRRLSAVRARPRVAQHGVSGLRARRRPTRC